MDIIDLRAFSTVVMFVVFIGIFWWAFAPSRKKRFEDDANLPFAEADERKHKQSTSDIDADKTQ